MRNKEVVLDDIRMELGMMHSRLLRLRDSRTDITESHALRCIAETAASLSKYCLDKAYEIKQEIIKDTRDTQNSLVDNTL